MKIGNWLIEFGLPIVLAASPASSARCSSRARTRPPQRGQGEAAGKGLRTATGKLYDLQERNEDAQSAEMAQRT
jgi:hypothetical protein